MANLMIIFNSIVSMSNVASIVIVIVILVRFLFKKAPKIFSYLLWAFVFIRLVFPFNFESKISVLNIANEVIDMPIAMSPNMFLNESQMVAIGANGISHSLHSLSMSNIFAIVWLLGMIGLTTYVLVSFMKIRKCIKFAIKTGDGVYESDNIQVPFVYGIVSPKIYLPMQLDEKYKMIVLAHENVHVDRKDYLIKLVATVLVVIYWFNPLVWIAYILMSKDMEFSCDEKVIKRLGTECKLTFGKTLLNFAMNPYVLLVSFGDSNTKERIKNILNYKKPKFWIISICLILCLFLIVPLLTNPVRVDENRNEANVQPEQVMIKDEVKNTKDDDVTKVNDNKKEIANSTNEENENAEITFIAPLKNYTVTCGVGCFWGHEAVDMKDLTNDYAEIHATASGVVEEVGVSEEYGNYIILSHKNNYTSFYGHMKEASLFKDGNQVAQDDVIGYTGMTGRASGTHVHFSIMENGVNLPNIEELIK